jgi:hypothetical protein
MTVANYVELNPRFTASPLVPPSVAQVRRRLSQTAAALAAALAQPASELAAGNMTASGVAVVRRAAAQRVLPSLEAERANLDRIEAERAEALASQHRAAADAEARLSPSVLARAAATARLFDAGGAGDKGARERFVRDVDAGATDAVLAACQLSAYGPMAAVAERGRERFLLSVVPPEKVRELRAMTCTLGLVRSELDALLDEVRAIARSGEEPRLTGSALLERANDAERVALIEEGQGLGVFEPSSTSTGTPSTKGSDRVPAVAAAADANRGAVPSGIASGGGRPLSSGAALVQRANGGR